MGEQKSILNSKFKLTKTGVNIFNQYKIHLKYELCYDSDQDNNYSR